MRYHFCISITCLIWATLAHAAQSTSFQAGIEAHEQGAYETAKMKFNSALETNETGAARHNLALTELKLGNPAEAIWQLERALLLNPLNSDYRSKLNLIQEQLGLAATSPKWYVQLAKLTSQRVWMIIASLSFWLLLALFVLPVISGKKADAKIQFSRLLSLIALVVSLTAIWLNIQHLQMGIVISNETVPLHTAPASAAPEAGFIRPGECARIRDQYNEFYKIESESSATGWISKSEFRSLIN